MEITSPHINLWAKLSSNSQPTQVIDYPRYVSGQAIGQIVIRCLTQEDYIRIQENSIKEYNRRIKGKEIDVPIESVRGEEILKNIHALFYVFEATRDMENKALPAFPSVQELSKRASPDEIAVLSLNILRFQKENSPIIAHMSKDELDGWIDRLAKDSQDAAYFLDQISSDVQSQLMLYMGNLLWKFQTDKFLLTSQLAKLSESEKLSSDESTKQAPTRKSKQQ